MAIYKPVVTYFRCWSKFEKINASIPWYNRNCFDFLRNAQTVLVSDLRFLFEAYGIRRLGNGCTFETSFILDLNFTTILFPVTILTTEVAEVCKIKLCWPNF